MSRARSLEDALADEIRNEAQPRSKSMCPMKKIDQPLRRAIYVNAKDPSVSIKGLMDSARKRGATVGRQKLDAIRAGSLCEGCVCEAG